MIDNNIIIHYFKSLKYPFNFNQIFLFTLNSIYFIFLLMSLSRAIPILQYYENTLYIYINL